MTTATVSRVNSLGLPTTLRAAQAAMHLSEVQEMLRRLSGYGLGIFMPHMHDERNGEFQPLPDQLVQVESGLEVSFHPRAEMAKHPDCFLPVAWVWRGDVSVPSTVCEMAHDEGAPNSENPPVKHKMSTRN